MKILCVLWALFLTAAAALGAGSPAAQKGKPVPAAPPKSAAEVTCYYGPSESFLPGGQKVGVTSVLLKRTLEPAKNTITEQVVTIDPRPDVLAREYVLTMQVSGARFTLTDSHKTVSGAGQLVGEAWKWQAWRSKAKLPDGGTLETAFAVVPQGLRVIKKFFGADGHLRLTYNEMLKPVPESECKERYDKAMAHKRPRRP